MPSGLGPDGTAEAAVAASAVFPTATLQDLGGFAFHLHTRPLF